MSLSEFRRDQGGRREGRENIDEKNKKQREREKVMKNERLGERRKSGKKGMERMGSKTNTGN